MTGPATQPHNYRGPGNVNFVCTQKVITCLFNLPGQL